MQNKEECVLNQLNAEIIELLNEIKNEQRKLSNKVENNHKVNMQKFARIIEFNEIVDMTNKVFERRISNIENKLNKILENKRVK